MLFIARDELNPDTWSPLRDRYPLGDKELSVLELLEYTLRQSDNNACDILFRRFGGPEAVDRCIRSLGFDCFAIAVTEEEMHTDPACCYANRSAPSEMALLLDRFVDRAPFATEYRDFIVRTMLACTTGTDRLPAGLANTEAVIGHKTGTNGVNGSDSTTRDSCGCRTANGIRLPFSSAIRPRRRPTTHAPLRKFRRRFSGISPA